MNQILRRPQGCRCPKGWKVTHPSRLRMFQAELDRWELLPHLVWLEWLGTRFHHPCMNMPRRGRPGHGSSAGGVPVHGAPGASAHGLPTNVQPPQVPPLAAPSVTMPAGVMTPPALPESLFVGFCPINPGEQRPAMSMHPGLTTPNQRQGAIMSKDATSGEVRTLSPTPYKGAQSECPHIALGTRRPGHVARWATTMSSGVSIEMLVPPWDDI